MSKLKIEFKRIAIFGICICLAFFGLTVRLGYIQLIKGDKYEKMALSQQNKDISIPPKRGIIYDRKGKELAVSVKKNIVWADPSKIKDTAKASKEISKTLGLEEKEVKEKLKDKKKTIVRIARYVDGDKVKELKTKKIPGIWATEDSKRNYPYGQFGSFIIGHVSGDEAGLAGVELEYDKYLRGLPGRTVMTTDTSGREIPYSNDRYNAPENGKNVVLTIDEIIQHYVEKALDKTLEQTQAKRVYCIMMDPKTGDILAMASKPDYNPNDPKTPLYPEYKALIDGAVTQEEKTSEMYKMWRNPMVNDIYEPGSPFKLVTGAAGIEENVVKPGEWFLDKGYTQVADRKIKNWSSKPFGNITFTQATEDSVNSVFIEVARRLGKETMYNYIDAFGFLSKTGIDLPGETTGLMYSLDKMGPVELATTSFGQSISVTPIQLITALSSIANDGNLMKPRIVKEILSENGEVINRFEPEMVRQVVSKETSKTMLTIMESVVNNGAGTLVKMDGYRIGAKTGTAQKAINGKYQKGYYISSFYTVAPIEDPQISMIVVVDEPKGANYFGSATAGPASREILLDTMRYMGIKPSYSTVNGPKTKMTKIPEIRNMSVTEGLNVLASAGLNYSIEAGEQNTEGFKIYDTFPKPGEEVPVGSNVILYLKNPKPVEVTVPDLKGKTIKESQSILEGLGLRIKTDGTGKVVKQTPVKGTKVDPGSSVIIELK